MVFLRLYINSHSYRMHLEQSESHAQLAAILNHSKWPLYERQCQADYVKLLGFLKQNLIEPFKILIETEHCLQLVKFCFCFLCFISWIFPGFHHRLGKISLCLYLPFKLLLFLQNYYPPPTSKGQCATWACLPACRQPSCVDTWLTLLGGSSGLVHETHFSPCYLVSLVPTFFCPLTGGGDGVPSCPTLVQQGWLTRWGKASEGEWAGLSVPGQVCL